MAPAQSINDQNREKLRSALWYSVGQTVDAVSIEQDLNASPQFIGALSELLWAQIGGLHLTPKMRAYPDLAAENASQDLESFAQHAGRSTINAKDVMLLARRNEGLEEHLKKHAKAVTEKDGKSNGR